MTAGVVKRRTQDATDQGAIVDDAGIVAILAHPTPAVMTIDVTVTAIIAKAIDTTAAVIRGIMRSEDIAVGEAHRLSSDVTSTKARDSKETTTLIEIVVMPSTLGKSIDTDYLINFPT